ncbi:MAG: hypothetical protein H0V17_08350 [Deltaproteobacteria bacterium]|nr:hypothetical protein [Deltaproteobacteria bacterium]
MKLGTLLLRNAAIGLSQLEAALRNQVLYGGRLGTNLVELGFIDLELLSSYLAELSGYPIATPTLLEEADSDLVGKLGSEEAHRLRAIPLGYIGEHKDTVAVAVVEPTNSSVLEELSARFERPITAYVVPELRALYYLEKHFGLPRRARFIRTARTGSDGDHAPDSERRRSQPAHGMVMPPTLTLEPRKRRASQAVLPIGPADRLSAASLAISYGAACERIDVAESREQIADALCDYAKGRVDALLVFLIRDGNALGWRGYLPDPSMLKTPIEELSLPLGGASALQSAHDAGQPFVGYPPSAAKPVETKLWTALGITEPTQVVVVPIMVKQRAVNLIYAHVIGGPPPAQLVGELNDLSHRSETSYLRLIRQARGS